MKSSLSIMTIWLAVVSADVSHLPNGYLPPDYHNGQNIHNSLMTKTMVQHNHNPLNGRVETTIEKHEMAELPTQTEILKEGQPVHGNHQQSIVMTTKADYTPMRQEMENLQHPQIPYEIPMREYLPPIEPYTTATDMPVTTTVSPAATTNIPTLRSCEETTTDKKFVTEQKTNIDNNDTTITEMPKQEQQLIAFPPNTIQTAENYYLPPTPQSHYLPPFDVMLPSPKPEMAQPTYKQYQQQLMREQQMQEVMKAMEQQQMIILIPPQQQPIAPVEPAHVLREDGYHYRTADNDFERFRYWR